MIGSCKCSGKHCTVCMNVNETLTVAGTVTHETCKINHQFNCTEYKDNNIKYYRSEACMQEHLFRHFSRKSHNGFLNDASITFIDKTNPANPLKREDFWRKTLKTMVPYGLNIEESV